MRVGDSDNDLGEEGGESELPGYGWWGILTAKLIFCQKSPGLPMQGGRGVVFGASHCPMYVYFAHSRACYMDIYY